MNRSSTTMLSAAEKDSLLNQFKIIQTEDGITPRSDSMNDFWIRYDEFIKKAGIKKGGGKCGRGWVGIKGSCDRMKKGGDRDELHRQSVNAFVNKQRSAKKMASKSSVLLGRSLKGKGGDPVGSPAYEKAKLREKYGGAASRIERLNQSEERRAVVSQGGLKQAKAQALEGVQEFDYVNPKTTKTTKKAPKPSTPKDDLPDWRKEMIANAADDRIAKQNASASPFDSKQAAEFAAVQKRSAMASGNKTAAKKWADEETRKRRSQLATEMQKRSATQGSMFGVTEYASDMPLFQSPEPSAPSTPSTRSTRSKSPQSSTKADLPDWRKEMIAAQADKRNKAQVKRTASQRNEGIIMPSNSRKSGEPRKRGRSVD